MEDKLTPKQKAFADEYLVDLNATRAYKAVYKNIKSENTAVVNGSKLLRNTKVANYLQLKMDERAKATQITAERTLRAINNLAEASITDVVTLTTEEDGTIKMQIADFAKLPENIKKAIQSIKQGKDGTIEIKMHDKLKALELQAKHLGMFNEKTADKNEDTEKALNRLDEVLKEIKGVV